MAGTRGFLGQRGEQIRAKTLRDYHFDSANKLNEDKVDIKFHSHREILEDTKIDVFVQANNRVVAGFGQIDVSTEVGARPVSTGAAIEGVVLTEKVQVRAAGTDSPIGDIDADVVYGRLTESAGTYTLTFYSIVGGTEQAYTFAGDAGNIDYRFIVRTNLSVVPVDAIVKGGAGFVEGATDAKAYMNLIQLMKDIYGGSGTLDNDGNANLGTNVLTQIANEVQARTDADDELQGNLDTESASRQAADQAIRDNLAATAGAGMVGVVTDLNYAGITVQAVLTELAAKFAQADSETGTRFGAVETKNTEQDDRLDKLESEDEEEVYEATGGETEYNLLNGVARAKTVRLALNGQLLAPGVNFAYKLDGNGDIIGFNFSPDTLKGAAQNTDGKPDVLFIQYKKIQ